MSLGVIGRWPRGHLHVRSVERWHARLAEVHQRVRSFFGAHRTQSIERRAITIDRPFMLTWRCTVRSGRTGCWPTSGHGAPDVSDREMEALGALCCAPDVEAWCIRCGTVLRPVIPLTVGMRSDRWRSAAEVECARTHGWRWCTGRWLPASGGTHRRVRWCRIWPSEGPTALFDLGAINESGGQPWLWLSTLGT
jgi:hypothetical protein